MSVIFYGMCGEGLGHCSRAIALIEHMPEHEFHIFTYGDAYDFLSKINFPNLNLINGLKFETKNDQIQIIPTLKNAIKFCTKGIFENKKIIQNHIDKLKPHLFITDWEPTIPRIANQYSISIDSQHIFKFDDLEGFPLPLRVYRQFAKLFCKLMIPKVNHYILSTYQVDMIERRKGVSLCQCFVRKQITQIKNENKNHILVYIRQENILIKVLNYLKKHKHPVICYGYDLKEQFPEVQFKSKDYIGFANDLATCHAVFSTAGIQLVGEARFFGKPSFVIPIEKQTEQSVNALFVDLLNLGSSSSYKLLSQDKVDSFLEKYKNGIVPCDNGVFEAAEIINEIL